MHSCPNCNSNQFSVCKTTETHYGIKSIQIENGLVLSYEEGQRTAEEELDLAINCLSCGESLELE